MILPVALISVIFFISASRGSEETGHLSEDEKCHKKDARLLKCRTNFAELQKQYSDLQSEDLKLYSQISKCQQDYSDLVKSHLEVLSQLMESEVKYEQMINQKNGEIDLLKNQISDQKKTSDFANLTNQFREDIAKLEKIVKIGGIHENKSEIETREVPTTVLPNINIQTPKTQTIDPCPRDQSEKKVFREIQFPGSDLFKVACYALDELGSGWLRVYHKLSISPIFTNGTYEDYERGFGTDITNEFFIGLNRLDHLTSGNPHEVFLSTTLGHSRCDNFVLGNRSEGYEVKSIDNCIGDDVWMIPKQGSKFSTFDRDEDGVPDRNLAQELDFGWWFDPSMSTISTTIRSTEASSRYGFVVFIRRTD